MAHKQLSCGDSVELLLFFDADLFRIIIMHCNSGRSTLQQGQGFAAYTGREKKRNPFKQIDLRLYLKKKENMKRANYSNKEDTCECTNYGLYVGGGPLN